jgi:hypothetical protein
MTRGGGQRGWGKASRKRMTQLEGGRADDARQVGGRQHNKKVVVTMAEDGGTRPFGCLPTLSPSHVSCCCAGRRRGRDLSLLKPGRCVFFLGDPLFYVEYWFFFPKNS